MNTQIALEPGGALQPQHEPGEGVMMTPATMSSSQRPESIRPTIRQR